jgi:hypothetical protein
MALGCRQADEALGTHCLNSPGIRSLKYATKLTAITASVTGGFHSRRLIWERSWISSMTM